jgi:hypothetical protein
VSNAEDKLTLQELEQWMGLAKEYGRLHSMPQLTHQQEKRLEDILELAIQQPALGFLIQEIDYLVAEQLGELDDFHADAYRDQQARLSEHHLAWEFLARGSGSIFRAYYGKNS